MGINSILKFNPIFQYRIWGGEKLRTFLNKEYTENNIGESWELSAVKGFESKLISEIEGCTNLKELIEKFPDQILGKRIYEKYGTEFPLLIKFIDAAQPLSVQVHPDDTFAKEHHNSFGKTEMWYVMEADENAEIISGFTKKIDVQKYQEALSNNEIEKYLKHWKVKKGDVIFLPAGRIHTIGAGILIAEIQQTSDITYRIYDYNRIEKDGKPRELHNDMAQKVINYDDIENPIVERSSVQTEKEKLVTSPYFNTSVLNLKEAITQNYDSLDSFVILIAVEGETQISHNGKNSTLKMGETVLIPASLRGNIELRPTDKSKILEVYIP